MTNDILKESFSSEAKETIIEHLLEEGYGTYAKRLQYYKFIVADTYHGTYIPVAAMFPDYAEIVVNPGMFDKVSVKGDETKILNQLSVVIRHELLHFLLVHQQRLYDHLKKIDSDFENTYRKKSIQKLANYAMDYDISLEGYDAEDKERVRLMTINGRVVGGLIAEDDHPEWGKKTMEEMFDILKKEHDKNMSNKPKTKINIKKTQHSKDYVDAYNEIMKILINNSYSDGDLAAMLSSAIAGDDVIDPLVGNILISAGE